MDGSNEGKGYMNYKLGAAFVVVFTAGAGVGAIIMKKVMENRYEYEEEYEYEDNVSCSTDPDLPSCVDEDKESEAPQPDPDRFRVGGDALVRSTLGSNQYEEAKKNYNIFKNRGELPDPDTGTDVETSDPELVPDKTKPYLISEEQYNEEFDKHDKLTLCYYKDGVLADENEELVDDIAHTIGIPAYAAVGNSDRTRWVRNEAIGADYEIVRMKLEYGDLIEPPPRRRKKYENHRAEED